MNLPTASHKRLILLWAFAIGWFYLGSLINFHQHHIWGKSLIPQINSCSRNKSKTAPDYGNDETVGFHLPFNDFISDNQNFVSIALNKHISEITNLYSSLAHPCIPINEGSAFSQLRGPPQM
jgi:hypothetical protein